MIGEVRVFGIRHHGPGSARSMLRALDEWQPDAVLVELAADCQPALEWIGHADLRPPVALLGYVVDDPQRAVFSPFAEFSPEWCAMVWAVEHGAALRPIDLPLANTLADPSPVGTDRATTCVDPLAALAAAAGDPDPERWWEDVVEHRGDGVPAFAAVAEAMAAVRSTHESVDPHDAWREAHMRRSIRLARTDGYARIAVVCGAWHVPALNLPGSQTAASSGADARLLRGLPRAKVGVSWVPWTNRRLSSSSGYAAGVSSPGWYSHIFDHAHDGADHGVTRWFVGAARLLRAHDLQASPDHLIGATRAAAALAALRGRPRAGLAEVLDAADAVMAGSGDGMALIRDRLIVGDAIGTVPDAAPQVPVARDLALQQRRARLKPEATTRSLELDVRTSSGRARSVLLHRLRGLGVHWGDLVGGRGSSGTFRETWRLSWEPELTIRLIELSAHGTTVEAAATHRLLETVDAATALADLVGVLDISLLADLPGVVEPVVRRLAAQAAHDADVARVIDALEPLARALRYGDVRGTDAASLRVVFDGLVVRVVAGLVGACRSLDDDAAAAMVVRLAAVQAALALTDHEARSASWPAVLGQLTERGDVHGLVRGRAARLLHDSGSWQRDQVERRLSHALSVGSAPALGAAFVEGFLAGSGTVLLHDVELLHVVDTWVSGLHPDDFVETAPLLRRTFGAFEPAERRQLGRLLAGETTSRPDVVDAELDPQRAAAAMVTVRRLLGVPS